MRKLTTKDKTMFKVIEVRFDVLTGNESEHILFKTNHKLLADEACKDANGSFKSQIPGFESFAVVVKKKTV